MNRRHVLVAAVGLVLAGCQSAPPPSLSAAQSGRFRITEVRVTGSDRIVSWPAAAKAYASQAGLTGEAALWAEREHGKRPPGVDAFFETRLTQLVDSNVRANLGGVFNGTDPARLEFVVNGLAVPSVAERVLVDNTADLSASIRLVDVSSGKAVLELANQSAFQIMLGGMAAPVADAVAGAGDPVPDMVADLIGRFGRWVAGT